MTIAKKVQLNKYIAWENAEMECIWYLSIFLPIPSLQSSFIMIIKIFEILNSVLNFPEIFGKFNRMICIFLHWSTVLDISLKSKSIVPWQTHLSLWYTPNLTEVT